LRVGIIGAGATGLAAAYDLVKSGHEVVVYERAPFLGGHASTFDVGAARLERGYHHWFTNDTDILELVDEIGLGDRVEWFDSTVGTLHDGKIYDFVTPMDLVRFTPLGILDRVRLGLVTLYLQRKKRWRDYESVTASDWLRHYSGKRAYEVFWGPMLRGKFGNGHFDKVGMPWLWGKIQTRVASRGKSMVREKLGYPMGSGGEVHLSASVTGIAVDDGRATGMDVVLANEEPRSEPFDAILATTPSNVFPRLVPSLPEDYLRRLADVDYMAAVLVVLVLDRPLSHVYWLNVADGSVPFVAVIEHTNMIDSHHYGGKHIAYISNYLTTDSPLYGLEHDELLRKYVPHLRKINPEFDPSWIETSYHHRIDGAQPVIGTHYSSRIPDHRTPFEGLYLANTTQVYPEDRGTNYSVRMGRRVATMVMDDWVVL
jgi:protoporphyrinogen oxidase